MDNELFGDKEVVKGIVCDLKDEFVIIVIVVVGSNVVQQELEIFMEVGSDFLNIIINENLGEIGKKIIEIILKGMFLMIFLKQNCFGMCFCGFVCKGILW